MTSSTLTLDKKKTLRKIEIEDNFLKIDKELLQKNPLQLTLYLCANKTHEQTFQQKGYVDGRKADKNIFNSISHLENAN